MKYSASFIAMEQNLHNEPNIVTELDLISKREQQKKLKETSVPLLSIRIVVGQCAVNQEGNR